MRVFLTGATGFIGGAVARALRDRGEDVRALVRSRERATDLESIGVDLAVGDVIDRERLPCVIVQPGGVYGPGDHSALGDVVERFAKGRLPALAFPELGFNMVHRDDVAQGILLALDRGQVGEAYVLGGEITTMRGLIETEARILDRRPPRRTMPVGVLKAAAPLGPVIGPLLGFPPNLNELIRSSGGVTYWAGHDKAVRELGYAPRPLEQGLRETLRAEGWLGDRAA